MAWSPLALRKSQMDAARRIAERTSALLGNSATLIDRAFKRSNIPSPLLLALRAANKLAQTLIEQPPSYSTFAQRRALAAAGAQIRRMASGILITQSAKDPNSVEFELAELISRTLALIDVVTKEPESIETTVVSEGPKLDK